MKVKDIENRIMAGETMYISTALKTCVISPKTLKSWKNKGLELFRDKTEDDKRDGFYMASGRKWVFVWLLGCHVQFMKG